jgi:hypothetical protein
MVLSSTEKGAENLRPCAADHGGTTLAKTAGAGIEWTAAAPFVFREAKFDRRLCSDVNAPALSLDLSQLVQAKDNVPELFFVVSGLGLDVGKARALFETGDGLQHGVGGGGTLSGLGAFLRRPSAASGSGVLHLGFQTIDLCHELVDIPFCRDLVMVKKKLHHCIKTDRFPLFSSHAFLLPVLSRSECANFASAFFRK